MAYQSALRMLASGFKTVLAAVEQLVAEPDPEEWVDQTRSPLGRRRHCELARRGKLPAAHKSGSRWLVKRKNLDAYIERQKMGHAGESVEEADILAFRAPARPRKKKTR